MQLPVAGGCILTYDSLICLIVLLLTLGELSL